MDVLNFFVEQSFHDFSDEEKFEILKEISEKTKKKTSEIEDELGKLQSEIDSKEAELSHLELKQKAIDKEKENIGISLGLIPSKGQMSLFGGVVQ